MFVSAGWCKECVARDLLFAREIHSGRIFFVCAACGVAGAEIETCHAHVREAHEVLAPRGWTLARREEVEAAGFGEMVAGTASEDYIDLITWYPAFQRPVIECNHG
jgi:hypothetical protein